MNARHDLESGSLARASAPDLLSDVLRSVRLTGSMFFLVESSTPWVSKAPDARSFAPLVLPRSQHMISYHVVTGGTCWAGVEGVALEAFEAGDILVVPHGDAYLLADVPTADFGCDTEEAREFFRQMSAGEMPSLVVEGGGGAERTHFICGFLGIDSRPFNPVLAALPRMIHLRRATAANASLAHLIEYAQAELRGRRSGSDGVLLKLAELMFIEVVRRYLDAAPAPRSGWLAGLRDPLVARALGCLHAAPAQAWTLDALAERIGSSRSVLAERFTQMVGAPPMHYLAQWRIQLASRMLDDDANAKVASVAAAVGYASEAAFSRAFSKLAGCAPAQWRQRGG